MPPRPERQMSARSQGGDEEFAEPRALQSRRFSQLVEVRQAALPWWKR